MVQIKQLKEASVFSVHFVKIYPKKNKRIKIIFQYLMINLLVWKSVFLFGSNKKDKLHDTGKMMSSVCPDFYPESSISTHLA